MNNNQIEIHDILDLLNIILKMCHFFFFYIMM